MADYLQNPTLKKIIKFLHLPINTPAVLPRKQEAIGQQELSNKVILTQLSTHLQDAVTSFLESQGATVPPTAESVDGLLFDGTQLKTVQELEQAYDFFHAHIKKLKKGGRIIILSQRYTMADYPEEHATARSLDGLARSLAKEIGRKGSTAQLIPIDSNLLTMLDLLDDKLFPLLQFLFSERSAFISGQSFHLSSLIPALQNPPLYQSLAGKVALVTGSARGIGAATAKVLAREGAKVIVLDIPQAKEQAEKTAKEINGDVLLLDISAEDAPSRVQQYVLDNYGGLDILVNNAGVTRDKTIAKMSQKYWAQALEINLGATIRITERLLESGLRDHGRIIGLSSISGLAGNFGQTNYAASKAGMIGYMEALANSASLHAITTNAVAPGFIETKMVETMPFFTKEGGRRLSNLSQGGLPSDVGEAIRFLVSPGAAGITGQVVRVCGGSMIGA